MSHSTSGPIRVLMVAPLLPPEYAGGGQQAIELSRRLIRKNVHVIALAGTNKLGASKIYRQDVYQIPTYRVQRGRINTPVMNLLYVLRFVSIFFRLALHCDIIHFHGLRLYPMIGVPIARLLRKKTIGKITLMGTDDPLTILRGRFGALRLRIVRALDIIVSLTREAEHTCYACHIDAKRVRRIPNGVDCDVFVPATEIEKVQLRQRLSLPSGPIILFTGIISYRKGIDILIDAMHRISLEFPDCTLLLVGPDQRTQNPLVDEQLLIPLREMRDVIMTGFVASPVDYIRAADIFVLPTRREGLSNALLEAMSAGLPAVVTDLPWLKDVGEGGTHFITFQPGSSESLTSALMSLLSSPSRRREMGRNARCKIEESFSLVRTTDVYHELYAQLFSRHTKADYRTMQPDLP